jgi:hypothetical protein
MINFNVRFDCMRLLFHATDHLSDQKNTFMFFLSGTPCKNRPKKKVDFRFFYFFFHFYESSGKKKLITSGKKNKKFCPHRCGRNPEKKVFRPVLMNLHHEK